MFLNHGQAKEERENKRKLYQLKTVHDNSCCKYFVTAKTANDVCLFLVS